MIDPGRLIQVECRIEKLHFQTSPLVQLTDIPLSLVEEPWRVSADFDPGISNHLLSLVGAQIVYLLVLQTMATLGRGCQLGPSFTSPCGGRGLCSSGQSVSAASVTYLRLSSERQQKPVNLKGANGLKTVFASRANIAGKSDSGVAAERPKLVARFSNSIKDKKCFRYVCHCQKTDQERDQAEAATDGLEETWGIQVAIALLKFYKTEISPLLPGSCRYVPTCSEYSMQAYRTYGVLKGTILTACRVSRCNPLGGSGFDPPRWFGEEKPSS